MWPALGFLLKKLYYVRKLFQPVRNKHTSLLGPFVSYEKAMYFHSPRDQNFIIFVSFSSFFRNKHTSLLGPFVSCKENNVLSQPQGPFSKHFIYL
jgi:hypothetical protein